MTELTQEKLFSAAYSRLVGIAVLLNHKKGLTRDNVLKVFMGVAIAYASTKIEQTELAEMLRRFADDIENGDFKPDRVN